jgi:hypothetical protein
LTAVPTPARSKVSVARWMATDLAAVAPDTAAYAARAIVRPFRKGRARPEIPIRLPTPRLIASVMFEHALLAMMSGLFASPGRYGLDLVEEQTRRTVELLGARGWLEDPAGFHQAPPPPGNVDTRLGQYRDLWYEAITFPSEYQPPEGEQDGSLRWDAPPNRTAHAYVLRHAGAPRPWLIAMHSYGAGAAWDFALTGAARWHQDLGFNVIAPVAPYHGPRRTGRVSGLGLVSSDFVGNLHAFGQTVWDARRCIAWAREQGAPSVSLHGISMGGFAGALVAAVEPDLDRVVLGVPAVDIAGTLRRRTPRDQLDDLRRHGLLEECLDLVHRPVSPLCLQPLVPRERLFLYAATSDRVTRPDEAYRLWQHWDEPEVLWFDGTHIAAVFAADVRRFIERALLS